MLTKFYVDIDITDTVNSASISNILKLLDISMRTWFENILEDPKFIIFDSSIRNKNSYHIYCTNYHMNAYIREQLNDLLCNHKYKSCRHSNIIKSEERELLSTFGIDSCVYKTMQPFRLANHSKSGRQNYKKIMGDKNIPIEDYLITSVSNNSTLLEINDETVDKGKQLRGSIVHDCSPLYKPSKTSLYSIIKGIQRT